jgi:hypothetical protein
MNPEASPKKLFTTFTTINIILFIGAIVACFYFFYIKKDFDFIVETSCDITKEECFMRDCTNPDDCPPNGLEEFKRYSLNAKDFKYCDNEDCLIACESNKIECESIPCIEDPLMGESCSQSIYLQEVSS